MASDIPQNSSVTAESAINALTGAAQDAVVRSRRILSILINDSVIRSMLIIFILLGF